eukprot:gene43234-57533_t
MTAWGQPTAIDQPVAIEIQQICKSYGATQAVNDEEIQNLDLAIQQKLEIARALLREPRILLLDESTSTLSGTDVQWIGELIAAQKRKGVTVVFITHRLPEVRSCCDTMTVLRHGRHIASGAVSDFTDAQVIEMIVGRKLEHNKAARAEAGKAQGAEVLGAQDLATSGKLQS